MAFDADTLVIAGNGHIYTAPVGSTLPTDVETAWDAAWVDLGYATDDGVTPSWSKDMGEVPAWQSFYAVRRMVTGESMTVAFTLLEWNADTVALALGGGTVVDTAGPPAYQTYSPPAPGTVDERALGIEAIDGARTYRIIIPRCMLAESVETSFKKDEAAALPITMGVVGEAGVDPYTIIWG